MPIVDLGLLVVVFCSIAIAGQMPSISSTSGFCNFPRNWRAYDDRLSIYLLCPSANKVLKANDDFGYVGQLIGYSEAKSKKAGGWIVVCKSTGQVLVMDADFPN